MDDMNLKTKIISETKFFFFCAIFIAIVLFIFLTYQRLILDEYDISYVHYGYSLFESFILAKIILIGQELKIGEHFERGPRIFVTLYKAAIFSVFVIAFEIIERFLFGFWRHKTYAMIIAKIVHTDIHLIAANILVMFFIFTLFFAFLEIGKKVGNASLFHWFFG